ncbi:MAG TPA: hypothetical protein VE631_07745 [Alphaproteobacteria bacterium]|nr:hypothetical protein [Alphaproteobacteria bacterium]
MRDRLAQVQANVAKQLLLNDLVPTLETNFDEYVAVVDQAPAWYDRRLGVVDPDHNTLGPKNAFWVALRNGKGEVVTCCAQRVWESASFVELVERGRFMYDGTKTPGQDSFRLFTDGLDHIRGNIAFSGGGWVHPKVRGNALPTLALVLAQAKLVQDWDVDYCFSIVRPELVQKGVAVNTYRFYHMDFGGTLWRMQPADRLETWVIHNSRADMERELSLWLNSSG